MGPPLAWRRRRGRARGAREPSRTRQSFLHLRAHQLRVDATAQQQFLVLAGLHQLARNLHASCDPIMSTGTTATTNSAPHETDTKDYDQTAITECLESRVKTLNPNLQSRNLAQTRNPDH